MVEIFQQYVTPTLEKFTNSPYFHIILVIGLFMASFDFFRLFFKIIKSDEVYYSTNDLLIELNAKIDELERKLAEKGGTEDE